MGSIWGQVAYLGFAVLHNGGRESGGEPHPQRSPGSGEAEAFFPCDATQSAVKSGYATVCRLSVTPSVRSATVIT